MKRLLITLMLVLSFVIVFANTTCKVEGSSNDNVATLKDYYLNSHSTQEIGRTCGMGTKVMLTKPSLGKTTVVVEIYDEYKKLVGSTICTIYKNQSEQGIYTTVKQPYDVYEKKYEPCGGYTLKIASATCDEKEEKNAELKKPDAYIDLGLSSGTLWKNSNEVYCMDIENMLFSKYKKTLRWYEPSSYYRPYSGNEKCYLEWTSSGIKVSGRELYETNYPKYVYQFTLPRGEKLNSKERDLFKIDEAAFAFDEELPTKEQWEELINECKWEWSNANANYGVKIIGPNGNSIFLPTDGRIIEKMDSVKIVEEAENYDRSAFKYSCASYHVHRMTGYYCAAFNPNTETWEQLVFNDEEVKISPADLDDRLSVRLVKALQYDNSPKYVDLGLPSGTKWKNMDEGYKETGFEDEENTPTKKQWEELKKYCTWTWMGAKFKVTGPNGKSIFFRSEAEKVKFRYSTCYLFTRNLMLYYVKDGFNGICSEGWCEAFCIDNPECYFYSIDGDPLRIRLVETPKKK